MEVADVDRDVEFMEREDSERYTLAPLSYTMVVVSGALLEEYCPEKGAESMVAWESVAHNAAGE